MPQYGYLVVEGPHDVEFCYRLFSTWGLRRVQWYGDLDPFWRSLVPPAFPHKGDLQKRVPVPLFLRSDTHSVAIYSASGDSRVVPSIEETLSVLPSGTLASIGVVLDDDGHPPLDRFAQTANGMQALGLLRPQAPGQVFVGAPSVGVYVLPDNVSRGTLEDLLVECAKVEYPKLLLGAIAFVDTVAAEPHAIPLAERGDFDAPAGHKKAVVGSIANILRPGRAVQVSIQDNRWLRGAALELARVAAIRAFLQQLFALP